MKKEKIIITGGLGYIGTELCKLYSGESWYKNIIVIDNRFISERVNQLRNWGINFIQCDILDKNKIFDILTDADVVHHLAGITDVAYTKTESNDEKDIKITKTAIEGTENIINSIPKNCKIIFPSTHVVYEGLTKPELNIDENFPVSPILTYSKSKTQNEYDIKNSGINYIILRLGSVYGYSTDTMRIGIMPNLFSKMSSQNQEIKLFSGGRQFKSMVSVIDVARCFKFFGDSKIKNEIFHLSNENLTVKEVAEICKKFKNDVKITITDDEIPNLGYTLSNQKLLSTGFKFLYNIEDSIKEMIEKWSIKYTNEAIEYKINGINEFIDYRGKISNYELTEPINLIGYIESKKGTMRANHFHPIQEQKCLLIKGRYISVVKDLSDKNPIIKTQIINAGDLSVIKPNVAHTMVFLEDSIFLNLVNGERNHENYGITHTIPYSLVGDDFKNNLLENYSTKCRSCNNNNIVPILSLGLSPLANNLLNNKSDNDEMYPLEMMYCVDCHNCQLSYVVPPKKLFDTYLYVSSTTETFRNHFKNCAEKYISDFNLNSNSLIIDIGSNDGIALKPFQEKGIKILGIEPAKNIADIAEKNNIPTINDYFSTEIVKTIIDKYGHSDIITASNVFAHSDKLEDMTHGVFSLLKKDGTFIVEVQYLLNTINDLTFDNIYHEHVNYWSVTSLNYFFNRLGYKIWKVEHINTHGGSIRVYVKNNISYEDESVEQFLKDEENFGLKKIETYLNFAKNVELIKKNIEKNITTLKNKNLKIIGYGSPAKATTSLNYFNINEDIIKYIIEDNKLKENKFIPGVKIPILNKKITNTDIPDIIIVMAWNFLEEIKNNNKELLDKGVKFISIKELEKNNYYE